MTDMTYAEFDQHDDLTMLTLDGVTVSLVRHLETGQLMVTILTEDATNPADHVPDPDATWAAIPLICVVLNDAVLYDREKETTP